MSWFPDADSITASVSKLPAHVGTPYHIGHIEEIRPILKQVTRYGQEMGLDMIQADYEDPGQVEMNFLFGPCVATADRLTTFRQICIQVAKDSACSRPSCRSPCRASWRTAATTTSASGEATSRGSRTTTDATSTTSAAGRSEGSSPTLEE